MASQNSRIGLTSAVFLILANVIGAGTFTTTGLMLAEVDHPSIVMAVWFVGGLVMISGAVCYGVLARQLPESGGEYLFISRIFHPALGCVAGWISLLVGFTAPIAVCAFALGEYCKPWTGLDARIVGSSLILAVTFVHSLNLKQGIRAQNLVITAKLILLMLFLLVSGSELETGSFALPLDLSAQKPGNLALCFIWAFFGYSGWNSVIYIAGEVDQPEKNLLRASLIGSILIMAIYLVLNLFILGGNDVESLRGRVDFMFIPTSAPDSRWVNGLVLALVSLALLSSLSAMIMLGPRVYARMADDGYLPSCLGSQHNSYRNAVIFQGLLALVILWLGTYKMMLTCIGYTLGISCAVTVLGLVRLKIVKNNFSIPFWPLPPLLFLGAVISVTIYQVYYHPLASLAGAAALLPGAVFWLKGRKGS